MNVTATTGHLAVREGENVTSVNSFSGVFSNSHLCVSARAALLCVDIARQDSSKQILQQPYGRLPEMTEHMDRTRLIVFYLPALF